MKKLKVAQRAMERFMLGIFLRNRIRNEKIRTRMKVVDIAQRISNLKWQWAGHIARRWMDGHHLAGGPTTTSRLRGVVGCRWYRNRTRWKSIGEVYVQQWTARS